MELESFEIVNDSIIESISRAFNLPDPDTYRYVQESSSVTLSQAAEALNGGGYKYHYYHGNQAVEVKKSDVESYTSIFKCDTDTEKRMTSHVSNAKKKSPRDASAQYLDSCRVLPDSIKSQLTKRKRHLNPYLDLWALCCVQLGFLGPLKIPGYEDPEAARQSHPILPVFMHHFGCAIPSLQAIQLIHLVSRGRTVIDIGCGNGYWTWLLRKETSQALPVVPVDDGSSSWRTTFVNDCIKSDAVRFLKGRDTTREVLLMVYPITGGNGLTQRIIDTFRGDTIIYVGTQNANRYTGFPDCVVEEYFEKHMLGWHMLLKVPVPSFPGKDDALYVFEKKKEGNIGVMTR